MFQKGDKVIIVINDEVNGIKIILTEEEAIRLRTLLDLLLPEQPNWREK